MDIISMQIANKVLKRMNKEFNGLYDVLIATEGQKEFITSKPHDIQNKGLHVYVNGYHATESLDYTHTNETTILFSKPLRKDDIVVLTTQIAGLPKYEAPGYDDTTIKGELESMKGKVNAIISALDDDGDGDLFDTIANLKAEWGSADTGLKELVNKKASSEELIAANQVIEQTKQDLATANEELVRTNGELAKTDLEVASLKELATSQAELILALTNTVTKLDKIINPTVEDIIKFNEPAITTIAKGTSLENEPPYQLMQINYSRLQEVESSSLTITGVGNEEGTLNKQYHTTPGATSVNAQAMFQWSYRDLSTLDGEGSNLDALERTNDTLLAEGTKLEFKIEAVKGGKTFSIVLPYTITSEDVINATYAE